MSQADQPALGPDGKLLDASKIAWYNDPSNPHPIQQEGEASTLLYSSGCWLLISYQVK